MDQYDNLRQGFEVGALVANHAKELMGMGFLERIQTLRLSAGKMNDSYALILQTPTKVESLEIKKECHKVFSSMCQTFDIKAPAIWDPTKPEFVNGGLLKMADKDSLRERVEACRRAIHDSAPPLVANVIDWAVHAIYVWEGIHYFN